MLSKRGKEISRAKTWLDSSAPPDMYNWGLFREFGGKPPIHWRLEVGATPSAAVGTKVANGKILVLLFTSC